MSWCGVTGRVHRLPRRTRVCDVALLQEGVDQALDWYGQDESAGRIPHYCDQRFNR